MNSSVRFVHCAGFLFDSRSWEGPAAWVNLRNQDIWRTFEAVLALCKSEKADFLFITGDLFEQESVRKETVERVARSLGRLEGTKVFITPGERDPLVMSSAYRLSEWPENVHIFGATLSPVHIPSLSVTVYGAGWTTYRHKGSLFEDFFVQEDAARMRFMLLHSEVEAERNSDGFIPLKEEQIAISGLTYLALGHQKNWTGIQQAGETWWADCGAVEARNFSEDGPHGVIVGETDGSWTRLDFQELAQRRYSEKMLFMPSGKIDDAVAQLLAGITDQERQRDLFRIRLPKSFQDSEQHVPTIQKHLATKLSYFELVSSEHQTWGQSEDLPGDPEWKTKIHPPAHPAFTEVLLEEVRKRLAAQTTEQGQTHWELVRKIGLAALNRHRQVPASENAGIIHWPELSEDELHRQVRNLRQTGHQDLSLEQAWDSLARAEKRVEEQAEKMQAEKAEYEALRNDLDAAIRHQDEQRLLRIEIKQLRVRKDCLSEKINGLSKIQKRLSLLKQNPDYRELRQILGELSRLEEVLHTAASDLTACTNHTRVDKTMLEDLRAECLEWAEFQDKAEYYADQIQHREQEIINIEKSLHLSGYADLPENEDVRLRQALAELESARAELETISDLFAEIKQLEETYERESARLQDHADLAEITETDERKIIQSMQRLAKWRDSKLSGYLDRVLKDHLSMTSINDRLTSSLLRYYEKYGVTDYRELKRQLDDYREQKQAVANLEQSLKVLRKEAEREQKLHRIIESRTQMLSRAYKRGNAADFSAWLSGWEELRQRKYRLSEMLELLRLERAELQIQETNLAESAYILREKIKTWGVQADNVDEVLAAVMSVARRLRMKEETERELASLQQVYKERLGHRSMEQLAAELEPVAELEREELLPDESRQDEMQCCRQELIAAERELVQAEKNLQNMIRNSPSVSDLEKKTEEAKSKWQSHDQLQHALKDTKELLETSRQTWLRQYGDSLESEVRRIISRTFYAAASDHLAASDHPPMNREETRQEYFAYRLASTLHALEHHPHTPLVFVVEKMKETHAFWEAVLNYLQELSTDREIVMKTSDAVLRQLADNRSIG